MELKWREVGFNKTDTVIGAVYQDVAITITNCLDRHGYLISYTKGYLELEDKLDKREYPLGVEYERLAHFARALGGTYEPGKGVE